MKKIIPFLALLFIAKIVSGQNRDTAFMIYSVYDYFEGDEVDQTQAVDIKLIFKIYGSFTAFSIIKPDGIMRISGPKYISTQKLENKRVMTFEYNSEDGPIRFGLFYNGKKLENVDFYNEKLKKHTLYYMLQ